MNIKKEILFFLFLEKESSYRREFCLWDFYSDRLLLTLEDESYESIRLDRVQIKATKWKGVCWIDLIFPLCRRLHLIQDSIIGEIYGDRFHPELAIEVSRIGDILESCEAVDTTIC